MKDLLDDTASRRSLLRGPLVYFLSALFFGIGMLAVTPDSSFALDLDNAKSQGLVGELPTGYLGSVQPTPAAEVRSLVERINAERRNKYQEIASKRGTPVSAVEALAGKTAIEKTHPGHFVQVDGQWRKK
ncbi:MAG: YdbL family protein [Bdellovibrionales bacterium]|nr:YdbL family protein [Bdellovibrionales bacterium]